MRTTAAIAVLLALFMIVPSAAVFQTSGTEAAPDAGGVPYASFGDEEGQDGGNDGGDAKDVEITGNVDKDITIADDQKGVIKGDVKFAGGIIIVKDGGELSFDTSGFSVTSASEAKVAVLEKGAEIAITSDQSIDIPAESEVTLKGGFSVSVGEGVSASVEPGTVLKVGNLLTVSTKDGQTNEVKTTTGQSGAEITADVQGITLTYKDGGSDATSVITGSGSITTNADGAKGEISFNMAGPASGSLKLSAEGKNAEISGSLSADVRSGATQFTAKDVSFSIRTTTGDDGKYTIHAEVDAGELLLRADGAEASLSGLHIGADASDLDLSSLTGSDMVTGDKMDASDMGSAFWLTLGNINYTIEKEGNLLDLVTGIDDSKMAENLTFGELAEAAGDAAEAIANVGADVSKGLAGIPAYFKLDAKLDGAEVKVAASQDSDFAMGLKVSDVSASASKTAEGQKVSLGISVGSVSGYFNEVADITGSASVNADATYTTKTDKQGEDTKTTYDVRGKTTGSLTLAATVFDGNEPPVRTSVDGMEATAQFDSSKGTASVEATSKGLTATFNGISYAAGDVFVKAAGEFDDYDDGLSEYSIGTIRISGESTADGPVDTFGGSVSDVKVTVSENGDDETYSGGYGAFDLTLKMTDGRTAAITSSDGKAVKLDVNGGNIFMSELTYRPTGPGSSFYDVAYYDPFVYSALAELLYVVPDGHSLTVSGDSVLVTKLLFIKEGGSVDGKAAVERYLVDENTRLPGENSCTDYCTVWLDGCDLTADYADGNVTYGLVAEPGYTMEGLGEFDGCTYENGVLIPEKGAYELSNHRTGGTIEYTITVLVGDKTVSYGKYDIKTDSASVSVPSEYGKALFLINEYGSQFACFEGSNSIDLYVRGMTGNMTLTAICGDDVKDFNSVDGYDAVRVTVSATNSWVNLSSGVAFEFSGLTDKTPVSLVAQPTTYDGRDVYLIDCSLDSGVKIYIPAGSTESPVLMHISENGRAEQVKSVPVTVNGQQYLKADAAGDYSYFYVVQGASAGGSDGGDDSSVLLYVGIAAAAIILFGLGAFFYMRNKNSAPKA